MRFLAYIESDPKMPFGPPPPELFEAIGAFGEEMVKAGVSVDSGGLAAIEASPHIRVSGGKLTVTDGPFAEAKEVIGVLPHPRFPRGNRAVLSAIRTVDALWHGPELPDPF